MRIILNLLKLGLTSWFASFYGKHFQNIKDIKKTDKKQCGFLQNGILPGPEEIYGELIQHESSKLNDHITILPDMHK